MRQGNSYIVGFAAVVCVVCSLLLAAVSGALAERQEQNRVLDRQKNVLLAAGFSHEQLDGMKPDEAQKLYAETFDELVVDRQGNVVEGKKPSALAPKAQSLEEPGAELPLFRQKDPSDPQKTVAYIYPIIGKGLWSTLYGYLAVKPDGNEVIGVAFYKHGETPGLGAEIERDWFTSNFKGKHIYEGGKLVGVDVVKGKVADKVGVDPQHAVDGISGATLTGNGVAKLMRVVPRMYHPFFQKSQGQKTALLEVVR